MTNFALSLVSQRLMRQATVLEAFAECGAVSPATAVPLTALTTLRAEDREYLEALLVRGLVREGTPGTFYRHDSPRPPASAFRRRVALFVLIVLATPAFFLWLVWADRR